MAGFQHSPADGARFKSEMFVPVRQDSNSFEERQRNIWDEMHDRMDRRRKEWDEEVVLKLFHVSPLYTCYLLYSCNAWSAPQPLNLAKQHKYHFFPLCGLV
jgi:hypothetical protein